MGGASTLIALGQEPRIVAVWVDSPFADLSELIDDQLVADSKPTILTPGGMWMGRLVGGEDLWAHSPQEGIRNDAGRPLYRVHGTADQLVPIHHHFELVALAKQTNANATAWEVDGGQHVRSVLIVPQEYERRLVTFFRAALSK